MNQPKSEMVNEPEYVMARVISKKDILPTFKHDMNQFSADENTCCVVVEPDPDHVYSLGIRDRSLWMPVIRQMFRSGFRFSDLDNDEWTIDGHKWYGFVLYERGVMQHNPTVAFALDMLVCGIMYLFKNKSNRDMVREYVEK